jgi:DNA-binding CsgD family transcriptional regulator
MGGGGDGDVIGTIETAYRIELPAAEWLRQLGTSFYEQLGMGTGLYGCEYRIVDGTRMQVGEELRIDMPGPNEVPVRESMEMMPIEFLRKTFARCDCGTQSQVVDDQMRPFVEAAMAPLTARYGWHDLTAFSGVDPEGHGVYFGAWLPKRTRLSAPVRRRWTRLAVHCATALRLRRRLAGEPESGARPEAVLAPSGRLEDASGEASVEDARTALREAVVEIERARGRLRSIDPDRAVGSWKGLVTQRWTLVDQFESDGKRYVVAHRNAPQLPGLGVLTDRERQVLGYAALGHHNKLIAYELGIAHSTVGVLLHRAARKLGTTSREELVARFHHLSNEKG